MMPLIARLIRFHRARRGPQAARRRRKGNERIQQMPHAEVLQSRTEVNRRQRAVPEGLQIELVAGFLNETDLVAPALHGAVFRQQRLEYRVARPRHRHIDALVVQSRDPRLVEIVCAAEFPAAPDRPVHRRRVERQDVRNLIEQFDRLPRLAIQLVDERHDRNIAQAADLEQLACPALDALRRVDDHDGAVDRRQRAIGLVGEVLVARRIEQVENRIAVLERHHRRHDGDAARPLDRHPVRARVLLVLLRLHLAGELNGASEQQELFRQRRLTGVGMRDDGERPPPRDLPLQHGPRRTAGRRSRR